MRNKLYLLLVLLVGIVQVGMAQEKTITGVVTDADDGSPLPGVSVVIKGTHLGTATERLFWCLPLSVCRHRRYR